MCFVGRCWVLILSKINRKPNKISHLPENPKRNQGVENCGCRSMVGRHPPMRIGVVFQKLHQKLHQQATKNPLPLLGRVKGLAAIISGRRCRATAARIPQPCADAALDRHEIMILLWPGLNEGLPLGPLAAVSPNPPNCPLCQVLGGLASKRARLSAPGHQQHRRRVDPRGRTRSDARASNESNRETQRCVPHIPLLKWRGPLGALTPAGL